MFWNTAIKRTQQSNRVQQGTAADVHQHGSGLHGGEKGGVPDSACLVGERGAEHQRINLWGQARQGVQRSHGVGCGVGGLAATYAGDVGPERSGSLGHRLTNGPENHDQLAGVHDPSVLHQPLLSGDVSASMLRSGVSPAVR